MIKGFINGTLFILFCIGIPTNGAFWGKNAGPQWLPPASIAQKMETNPKPVLVDVYTPWCVYCKVMDATVWKNDSVVNYLNQHFYAVKLNAEEKDTVQWNGKNYAYQPKYKLNTLAIELLRGNMVYPSTVVIPAKGEWQVIPGAMKVRDMELLLKYYGSLANEKMDFETYRLSFSGKWN